MCLQRHPSSHSLRVSRVVMPPMQGHRVLSEASPQGGGASERTRCCQNKSTSCLPAGLRLYKIKHDGLGYCFLALPVAHTSRRSWPQGKRPASQGELCRRDRNGSRDRRAYPISGLEAAVSPRVVIRPRRRNSLEFGWSRGHRGTRHFYVRNSRSSTTSREARLRSAVRQRQ
jgi:hypothetical protein